jgi:hypothetical protein
MKEDLQKALKKFPPSPGGATKCYVINGVPTVAFGLLRPDGVPAPGDLMGPGFYGFRLANGDLLLVIHPDSWDSLFQILSGKGGAAPISDTRPVLPK